MPNCFGTNASAFAGGGRVDWHGHSPGHRQPWFSKNNGEMTRSASRLMPRTTDVCTGVWGNRFDVVDLKLLALNRAEDLAARSPFLIV